MTDQQRKASPGRNDRGAAIELIAVDSVARQSQFPTPAPPSTESVPPERAAIRVPNPGVRNTPSLSRSWMRPSRTCGHLRPPKRSKQMGCRYRKWVLMTACATKGAMAGTTTPFFKGLDVRPHQQLRFGLRSSTLTTSRRSAIAPEETAN